MKKVFFIAAANSIHTVKWVNALSEYFEIHLIYCSNHKPDMDKINEKVILHEMKYRAPIGYYINALTVKKMYKEIRPEIINVHYASGYGTLARMAKLPNVLLSVWGSDVYRFPKESNFKKKILSKNVKNAKWIASTSEIMVEELEKEVSIKNKEVFITPFGVDTNKFKKVNTTSFKDEFRIGIVKSLKEVYGIDYAIEAIKFLKDKLILNNEIELAKKIKMFIYGEGPEKENLEKLIKNQNLVDCVFLKGKVPNKQVPEILNNFNVFCASSIQESFGVSVIEAMACELPVVATQTDGFCEVMENEKTGYLVKVKDAKEIANGLEKILKDKELSQKMGKDGRNRVMEKYDWNENVQKMKEIYEICGEK